MPKYLIKPSTQEEYWDIPAVLLTLTDENTAKLRTRINQAVEACKALGADRINYAVYHDDLIGLTAIDSLRDGASLQEQLAWIESAEDDDFLKVEDDFDPNDHETWRTDCEMISIHKDGDVWLTLQNHWGSGELEINLPRELYDPAAAKAEAPAA